MKAKFKRDQLYALDQKVITLNHPKHGDTGIEVTLAGPIHPQWQEAFEAFSSKPQDDKERVKEFYASLVLGWDEEAMGPFSKEEVLKALSDPKETWVLSNIMTATEDRDLFFL